MDVDILRINKAYIDEEISIHKNSCFLNINLFIQATKKMSKDIMF